MNTMKIIIEAAGRLYSVVREDKGYKVVAEDIDEQPLADLSSRHAKEMTKLHYSPDLGERYAFFAKIAAAHLGGKLASEVPPGKGELEKGSAGNQ